MPPLLVVRVLIFLVVASLVASWQVAISLLELPVSGAPPEAPKGLRLLVTIPKLGMKDMPTTYTSALDEDAARHGLLHDRCTDFPWEPNSNVYLAGHDLGYPGTRSWKIFWNLHTLERGDLVYIRDSMGTVYSYRVYESL